jgi:hypothetical protein
MSTTPKNEQMDRAIDRIAQQDAEVFRQQQLARFRQERAQQGQRDIEASAEIPRQPVENPT